MVKEKTEAPQPQEVEEITLWSNPVATVSTLALCCVEWLKQGSGLLKQYYLFVVIIIAVVVVPHVVNGPHTPVTSTYRSWSKNLMTLPNLLVGGSVSESLARSV